MRRILTSEDIPLVASATLGRLGPYSIGFVRVLGNEDDATILGSGTLVKGGGRHAVLTADHVLEKIPAYESIWLVICREGWMRPHRVSIGAGLFQEVTMGKASHDADGPDIGLVLLAPRDAAMLEGIQTFYNLEKQRDRVLGEAAITEFGWALFGMVHELTADANQEPGFTRVKGFTGSVVFGAKPVARTAGNFDYLDFVALYDEHYSGPESYQGVSGGGLWQVSYGEKEGTIEITDAVLSGVVYYESPRSGDSRTIFCHGRRSIYDIVYGRLTQQE